MVNTINNLTTILLHSFDFGHLGRHKVFNLKNAEKVLGGRTAKTLVAIAVIIGVIAYCTVNSFASRKNSCNENSAEQENDFKKVLLGVLVSLSDTQREIDWVTTNRKDLVGNTLNDQDVKKYTELYQAGINEQKEALKKVLPEQDINEILEDLPGFIANLQKKIKKHEEKNPILKIS